MFLTKQEEYAISVSFVKVAMRSEDSAALFYERLFEIEPETRALFVHTDMKEQGYKLLQTIGVIVGAIDKLHTILPDIEDLGNRHIAYGVTKSQYEAVGEALIWMLDCCLGEDFMPETKEAWQKIYKLIAETATKAYQDDCEMSDIDESS